MQPLQPLTLFDRIRSHDLQPLAMLDRSLPQEDSTPLPMLAPSFAPPTPGTPLSTPLSSWDLSDPGLRSTAPLTSTHPFSQQVLQQVQQTRQVQQQLQQTQQVLQQVQQTRQRIFQQLQQLQVETDGVPENQSPEERFAQLLEQGIIPPPPDGAPPSDLGLRSTVPVTSTSHPFSQTPGSAPLPAFPTRGPAMQEQPRGTPLAKSACLRVSSCM